MQLLLLLEGILLRNPSLESDACLFVCEVRLLLGALTEAATRAQERAGVERRAAAPTNKHILSFVRLHSSTIFEISQELKSAEGFRTMKHSIQRLRERRPAHGGHQTRWVESGLEVLHSVSSHPVNPVNAVLSPPSLSQHSL